MITTLKEAEAYLIKCYAKFADKTLSKEEKLWYTVAKNILVEKMMNKELK